MTSFSRSMRSPVAVMIWSSLTIMISVRGRVDGMTYWLRLSMLMTVPTTPSVVPAGRVPGVPPGVGACVGCG